VPALLEALTGKKMSELLSAVRPMTSTPALPENISTMPAKVANRVAPPEPPRKN